MTTVSNAALQAQIMDLRSRLDGLAAQYKKDQTTLAAVIANAKFLGALNQMTVLPEYTLPTDPYGGLQWGSGERDYINTCVNAINDLVGKLQRQGYMGT